MDILKDTLFSDLGGETWRIRRFAQDSDKRWSAFNPSVSYSPVEGYVVLMRSSNYFFDPVNGDAVPTVGLRVRSRMWLANLSQDWEIVEETMREIDFSNAGIVFLRGAEDGRLYWRDGGWEFTAGIMEPSVKFPRIGLFRLDGSKAVLVEVHKDGELYDIEKNWMPTYEVNPNFDYVYGPNSVYIRGKGVKAVREMLPSIEGIRGGSPLWDLGDSTYLTIIHEADNKYVEVYSTRHFGYKKKMIRKYFHRFARYDQKGQLFGITDKFQFNGVNIEFAAGLVVSGDDVIISYGYKDVSSYLAKIKLKKVMEMIEDV